MRLSYRIALPIAALVVLLDQLTKLWIQEHMVLYTTRTVIPGFFNIVHVLNRGAAFGFLNRSDIQWQTYFFFAATALAVMIIFHLLRMARDDDKLLITGLGLILGGAVGNLIDRIRQGLVIDFFDFRIWPVFNVADIAIVLGVAGMIFAILFRMNERE